MRTGESTRRASVLRDYDSLSDSVKDLFDDVPESSSLFQTPQHRNRASTRYSIASHVPDAQSTASSARRGGSLMGQALQNYADVLKSQTMDDGSDQSSFSVATASSHFMPISGTGVQTAYGRRGLDLTKRQSVRIQAMQYEAKRVAKQEKQAALPAKKKQKKANYLPNIVGDLKTTVGGKDVFEDYDHKKKANSICRWNLLWLVLLLLAPYPLWLTFLDCKLAYEITIVVNLVMTFNFIYTTFLCWRYMWRMIRAFNTPFWEELIPEMRDKVQHIVVMPTYKEPIELLLETISSIANQTVADSIILVVGMEERTPEQETKKQQINQQFGDTFKALIYAVHPSGVPGEIPGACSNRNYAARTAVKHMIREGMLPVDPNTKEVDLDFTLVTVCDADTTFYYRYFENLTWLFLNENPSTRFQVCWQSPLFYNIALDRRWFFTRVMGILRSYFMIGFLIGCDINTMSIYSQSLRLLVESRYFHPGYQMDDIIYTLSAMKATGKRIRIRVIDIPTLSGPTSGDTMWQELDEWIVQATRWTIGAAEVFHYFFVKLLRGNYFLPGIAYFWWFVYYYGFVLCVAGLINISNTIIQLVSITSMPEISIETCRPFGFDADIFPYSWVFPFFIIFTYTVVYGTAFFMDALVCQVLALAEDIHPLRNLAHFLSTQFVLWLYCLVEYKSIFTIAIYGKKVCGHKASEKGSLVKSDPNKVPTSNKPDEPTQAVESTQAAESTPPPPPQPPSNRRNEGAPASKVLPSIIDEEDSFSFAPSSSASVSSSSKDVWNDEEHAEVASSKGEVDRGSSILANVDESIKRLENRFQQKLSEKRSSVDNGDKTGGSDQEAWSIRRSLTLSTASTVAASNAVGTQQSPFTARKKVLSASSSGSRRSRVEDPPTLEDFPQESSGESSDSSSSSPAPASVPAMHKPQNESTWTSPTHVPSSIGAQKESSKYMSQKESNYSYGRPLVMNGGPLATNHPPPSVVTAEASPPYDSSWMQEGVAVTRRPLILQLLDWNREQQDKSEEHGPSTPFMTGIINGLDEEACLPPGGPVQPAMVVFRSYLRR